MGALSKLNSISRSYPSLLVRAACSTWQQRALRLYWTDYSTLNRVFRARNVALTLAFVALGSRQDTCVGRRRVPVPISLSLSLSLPLSVSLPALCWRIFVFFLNVAVRCRLTANEIRPLFLRPCFYSRSLGRQLVSPANLLLDLSNPLLSLMSFVIFPVLTWKGRRGVSHAIVVFVFVPLRFILVGICGWIAMTRQRMACPVNVIYDSQKMRK